VEIREIIGRIPPEVRREIVNRRKRIWNVLDTMYSLNPKNTGLRLKDIIDNYYEEPRKDVKKNIFYNKRRKIIFALEKLRVYGFVKKEKVGKRMMWFLGEKAITYYNKFGMFAPLGLIKKVLEEKGYM
jgi:hypothetical protein